MTALAPCPWCGRAAELHHANRRWRESDDQLWMVYVGCPDRCCGAEVAVNVGCVSRVEEAEAKAASRWNTRAVPSAVSPSGFGRARTLGRTTLQGR